MRWVMILVLALTIGAPAWANDALKVGTPEPVAFVFAALDVGIRSGIFEKHALDVTRVDFAGGAKLHQAIAAGAIDAAVGTGSDLLFIAKGAPERAVAAYGNDLAALSVQVRAADPTLKTVSDLRGKTVGTTTPGSFTTWLARQVSIHQGWGPDGFKLAYLGAQSGLVAGLMAKDVDAIVGTTAGGLQLQKEGKVRVLRTMARIVPDFISGMLYASDRLINDRPDVLRRFLAGWFETARLIRANKAETIRLTQPDTKVPDDIAAEIYDEEAPTFFTEGRFDRKKLAAVKQSLIDTGVIASMPPDDALINESFLP
ncbi:MAG TPA: ABC transporter substrate-binding protein [Stellaceae bacterium]|nr:ABC transporter substrate-binding protein [Stellaceae bacterium]